MTVKAFNDTFLRACRQETTDHVPVWYMRQAGRYQPEYRAIRAKHTFFEMNYIPEVCAEVTRLPVEQLGVDAAILFADIMTPLKPIGVDVNIESGIGPVIANPVQSMDDVNRLGELDPDTHVPYIMEAIKILRQQLSVPLIGFAGAPFTLASYIIEGGPSKHYHKTKAFMYTQPQAWDKLMEKLGTLTINYLKAQIAAGAQAVQIFDSWVGALNDEDYRNYIAPVMTRILQEVKPTGVPTIYFGVGCGHLLDEWNKLPVDVLGLDWRTTITTAREMGITKTLQGNLDPTLLLAPWEKLESKAKEILDEGTKQPGFIFNLGHGVFPDAKVETLQKLTRFIHSYRRDA
ncbi:uroporphyrinogen decarboxylase [Brevibacillus composti]|uniref:Uroporphyrinogen decarboxylase n=1 Tax=Brevibacillus composti TaxID=2796470 RepID=A0A7T5EIL7_9BACL|nr:uroporphyrinogen decarboxylase [Brevibacillus composti]QQE73312.1 uroporphyrinogen decarboxylase [Brevibacillus composti]QUO40393.1 uroporphyrinogen decarboxylase [Brevibacillus composti]